MAYVPGFEYDIFLSYAHVDDEDPFGDGGWVTRFERALRTLLRQKLPKQQFSMWRDLSRLPGGTLFEDEIRDSVEKSAVLLALHSPGYVDSGYCLRELRQFVELAKNRPSSPRLRNRIPVFRVDLDTLRDQEVPPELAPIQACRFYEAEEGLIEEGGKLLPEGEPFKRATDKLARQIANFLVEMRRAVEDEQAVPQGPAVFLAATTPDLAERREAFRQELLQYNIPLIDGSEESSALGQPSSFEGVRSSIQEKLGRATISVHMIGRSPGEPILGDPLNESLERLHYRLAIRAADAGRVQDPGGGAIRNVAIHEPKVLVWTPPDVIQALRSNEGSFQSVVPEAQVSFLRELNSEPSDEMEWIQQGFQDVLAHCFRRLGIDRSQDLIDLRKSDDIATEDAYILLSGRPPARDHDHFSRIEDYLTRNGCFCEWEFTDDKPLPDHAAHYDGILILHLDEQTDWATERVKQAAKLVYRRRSLVAGVYDGPPKEKNDIESGTRAVPIFPHPRRDEGEFDCRILDEFLARLPRVRGP